jgi:hypothetical protein
LNTFGNTPDDVISAETLLMVREHFIKTFGVPTHTIGLGGSGGAIQQYLIAQNYPGLLDGIIPVNSFPDVFTTVPSLLECGLLAHVFDTGLDRRGEVSGHGLRDMGHMRQSEKITVLRKCARPGCL